MKNNYFSRCVLLAGLCSVIMVFAVTPVYATGGAFSPLPHAVSEGDITVTGKVVDDVDDEADEAEDFSFDGDGLDDSYDE